MNANIENQKKHMYNFGINDEVIILIRVNISRC